MSINNINPSDTYTIKAHKRRAALKAVENTSELIGQAIEESLLNKVGILTPISEEEARMSFETINGEIVERSNVVQLDDQWYTIGLLYPLSDYSELIAMIKNQEDSQSIVVSFQGPAKKPFFIKDILYKAPNNGK